MTTHALVALFLVCLLWIEAAAVAAPICPNEQSVHYLTTTKEVTTVINKTFTLMVDSAPNVTLLSAPLKVPTTPQTTHLSTTTGPLAPTLSGLKTQDSPAYNTAPTFGYRNAAYFANW